MDSMDAPPFLAQKNFFNKPPSTTGLKYNPPPTQLAL